MRSLLALLALLALLSPVARAAEAPEPLGALHEQGVNAFIESKGFGIRRMMPMHRPEPFPKVLTLSGKRWNVTKLELIGIARNSPPVAYRPGAVEPVKTRPLTPFETESLRDLSAKTPLLFKRSSKEILVVGAVLKQAQCLQCHKNDKGDVLGALTYVLRPAVEEPTVN